MELPLAHVPRPQTESRGLSGLHTHTESSGCAASAVALVGRFNGWDSVVLMTESFLLQRFIWCYFMTFQLNSSDTSGVQYIKHIRNLLHYCSRPPEAVTPQVYWPLQLRPRWWKDLTAKQLLDVKSSICYRRHKPEIANGRVSSSTEGSHFSSPQCGGWSPEKCH